MHKKKKKTKNKNLYLRDKKLSSHVNHKINQFKDTAKHNHSLHVLHDFHLMLQKHSKAGDIHEHEALNHFLNYEKMHPHHTDFKH